MTIRRIRLGRGQFDWELLYGVLFLATAGAAMAWVGFGLPVPPCIFSSLTGISCISCGGTRCLRSLMSGDLAAAAWWNPLALAGLLGSAALFVYSALAVAGLVPRFRLSFSDRKEADALRLGCIALLAGNWIYLIWRG